MKIGQSSDSHSRNTSVFDSYKAPDLSKHIVLLTITTLLTNLMLQDVDQDVAQIQKAMETEVDVSFDCAGFNKTMSTALSATRAGGKVCLVGMGHNEMTVPLTPAAAR